MHVISNLSKKGLNHAWSNRVYSGSLIKTNKLIISYTWISEKFCQNIFKTVYYAIQKVEPHSRMIIIKKAELKYFLGLRLHYYGGLCEMLTGEG